MGRTTARLLHFRDCELNRGRLPFACGRCYIGGMWDAKYWTKKLREAERELEAATRRTEVDLAARTLMRIKAELKRIDQAPKVKARRRSIDGLTGAASQGVAREGGALSM
jgi:hypothetical protein